MQNVSSPKDFLSGVFVCEFVCACLSMLMRSPIDAGIDGFSDNRQRRQSNKRQSRANAFGAHCLARAVKIDCFFGRCAKDGPGVMAFRCQQNIVSLSRLDTLGGFCKHPLRCVLMLCSRKCGAFTVISRHWQGYLSCLKCSTPCCFDVACFFDGVISRNIHILYCIVRYFMFNIY